jgi:3-phenylpropionate/trans-cinnamate dioxygenase ferredoxin reductase subunit
MISGPHDRVVIVGAGHGGATFAALLRQSGFAGPVTMVGAEPHPPYHRPPLSKKFDGPAVEQLLRPREFYAENAIDLRTGTTVVEIDRTRREVTLSDGALLDYRTLVLATGSRPRLPAGPVGPAAGILTLRTLDDARALDSALARPGDLVIVGGGYVGMEVAAVARSSGRTVTVVEREQRILARVASPELSVLLTEYHRGRGTTVITGASVAEYRMTNGAVSGVLLDDGRVLACGAVLVGIGAVPNDQLAVAAGIDCGDGVITDENCRTSDPDIFAIGDVARRPMPGHPGLLRMESIPAATEHAKRAAAVIAGTRPAKAEVPWFWSDQFDLKLKIAGLSTTDATIVARPGAAADSASFLHVRPDSTVVAVETVNAPSDFMAGRSLIGSGAAIDVGMLADPNVPLRDVVADARARV